MEKKKVIAVAIGLLLLAAVLLPGLVDSPIAGASPLRTEVLSVSTGSGDHGATGFCPGGAGGGDHA